MGDLNLYKCEWIFFIFCVGILILFSFCRFPFSWLVCLCFKSWQKFHLATTSLHVHLPDNSEMLSYVSTLFLKPPSLGLWGKMHTNMADWHFSTSGGMCLGFKLTECCTFFIPNKHGSLILKISYSDSVLFLRHFTARKWEIFQIILIILEFSVQLSS